MIPIRYTYGDEDVRFTVDGAAPGLLGRLLGSSPAPTSVDDWVAGDTARCDALGALRMYSEQHPGSVRFEEDAVVASHAAVASLGANQARALGLPERPPFVLATGVRGIVGSPGFKLTAQWLDSEQPFAAYRQGAFLETAGDLFLIPEPLFSAVELADGFEGGAIELPDHWAALARFRRLLDAASSEVGDATEMSAFLSGLRIYTGAALSLSLSGTGDNVGFDPVLFDGDATSAAKDDGRILAERDGILPANLLRAFQRHSRTGFQAFAAAKSSYLLGRNTYLIVDDDLETALQVVREKQQAEPAERRAFAANPRAAIAERLAEKASSGPPDTESDLDIGEAFDEDIEARAGALFVETPEYADRAVGIGIWQEPSLGFVPHTPNVWLPETFALELGGVWVRLDFDTVRELRNKVDHALETNQPHVDYQEQRIPATPEVREKLANTVGTERPAESADSGKPGIQGRDDGELPLRMVAFVHENFVEENWSPHDAPREVRTTELPPAVRSALFEHQRTALEWQIEAWRAGYPGVLNADDQGLGKTLQTLAFLAWVQARMSEGPREDRKPVLVVAPTGLLRTWEGEARMHLAGTGLGARIEAHGAGLRALRVPNLPGRDTDDGEPRLAFEDLRSGIDGGNGHRWWVLTTYETLASYQHSFRQIDFAVVVFDEIQKVKNPKTLIALATRSVRATFRIGLTGTPIENQVADLWAIMDAVAPGRLGTLEEYLVRYGAVTEENMRELHGRIFKPIRTGDALNPPIGQRRLKEREIGGLPRKDYRLYPAVMPGVQAEVYERARDHLLDGARGGALKLLHHIRGVSLHPATPESTPSEIDEYFAHSARFESLRNIVARIHERGERALLFTEDRRMQAFVAQWLRSKFGLAEVRIVNGATAIARRKQYVSEFQRHMETDGGFDILILSPRAAGVGLTLTAATHVIHLSRWWNPAVEEQCNDRIYRIGQKRDVTVHLPLAIHPGYRERSFDCVLNDLMRRKAVLAHAALWPPTDSDLDNGMLVTGISGADPFDPASVDDLDWNGFEDWVVERAVASGDWEASKTHRSGDGGADAILRHRRRRSAAALVQVKHTTERARPIGEAAVHEVLRAARRYELRNPQLVALTNARDFTDHARKLALEQDVALVDRDRLGLWPSHVLG